MGCRDSRQLPLVDNAHLVAETLGQFHHVGGKEHRRPALLDHIPQHRLDGLVEMGSTLSNGSSINRISGAWIRAQASAVFFNIPCE
jgi:hypothetical protein